MDLPRVLPFVILSLVKEIVLLHRVLPLLLLVLNAFTLSTIVVELVFT